MHTAKTIAHLKRRHEHKNIIDRYGYIIIQLVALVGLFSSIMGLAQSSFNLGTIFGITFIFSVVLFVCATYWQQQEHHL